MRRVLFLLLLTVILAVGGIRFLRARSQQAQEVHYHAGFLVYRDGVRADLSGIEYMHIEACSVRGEEEEDEQLEKAHLHDGVGDVVHVHREGARWRDLFSNIGYTFPETESVTGYRNGERLDRVLDQPIEPNESVIIVVGGEKGVDLNQQVTRERINQVEQQSEGCGAQLEAGG